VIGAFGCWLSTGWCARAVPSQRLTRALEGRSAVLVMNGQLDRKAMERESLSREELLSVIHKQGFEDFHQVRKCELEPNGTSMWRPSTRPRRQAPH